MSARGQKILINPEPKGVIKDGIILGNLKPGICLEIETPFYQGNRHRYQPADPQVNAQVPIIILLESKLRGYDIDTAHVSGELGQVYYALPGDELNLLLADVAGTGDTHTALNMYGIQGATGKLIVESGTFESTPFQLLQSQSALTADVLAPFMVTGY